MKFLENPRHVEKRAFNGLVQEITSSPKFIGSRSAYDVAYLLMQAYLVFVKQLPPRANFEFRAELKFASTKGGDDNGKHSEV